MGYSDNYWHTSASCITLPFSLLVLALFVSGWCHQSCQFETTCQFLSWQNRIKVLFSYLLVSFHKISSLPSRLSVFVCLCPIPWVTRYRDIDLSFRARAAVSRFLHDESWGSQSCSDPAKGESPRPCYYSWDWDSGVSFLYPTLSLSQYYCQSGPRPAGLMVCDTGWGHGDQWPVSAHSSPPWLGVLWPRTSQLQWPRSTEESWHWRGADTSSHHPPPLSHNVTSGGHAQVMTYESHGVLATLISVCQKSLPSPNLTRSCVVAGGWGEVLTAVTAGLRMAQLSAAATAAVKYHFGQNGTDIVHTGCGEWGRGCLWQLNDDSFSIRLLCSNTKLIISLILHKKYKFRSRLRWLEAGRGSS